MQADVSTDRDKYIGGSDCATIVGLEYFKTYWELVQEKAGLWKSDFKGNEYTDYGNEMESKIRDYVNFMYDADFKEDRLVTGNIRCHADGHSSDNRILEIKTTSRDIHDARDAKEYVVQLLFYMNYWHCADGLLAVYKRPENLDTDFDPTRLSIFCIDVDMYQDWLDELITKLRQFMEDVEYLKEHPDAQEGDLPSRRNLEPIADKVLALENQMTEYKKIEKQYKQMKEKLKNAMQQQGIRSWTMNGGTKITLVPDGKDTEVEAFDEELFKQTEPDKYNSYLYLKPKKGKTGYIRIITPKEQKG